MSLSRTWARRRGDTSAKRREAKIDHRVNVYEPTAKAWRWFRAMIISGRIEKEGRGKKT